MTDSQSRPSETGSVPVEESLDKLRTTIGGLIVWGFGVLFLITVAAVLFATSVQVAFGTIIGYACVWIGLMMTWFGVNAAYDLSVKASTGEGAVETSLTTRVRTSW